MKRIHDLRMRDTMEMWMGMSSSLRRVFPG